MLGMLPTVELDDQPFFRAAKVRNISFDRPLSTKFAPSKLSAPQSRPQLRFRTSLFAAEAARTLMQHLLLPQ